MLKTQKIQFTIPRPSLNCQVFIGSGLVEKIQQSTNFSSYTQVIIITDEKVAQIWGERIKTGFKRINKPLHLFKLPSGEKYKTEAWANKILYKILRIRPAIDRKVLLIAFGGGVVGDITGYLAAKCLRGVDYWQIPTTFLAMVDSSLGGKTGIDFEGITNMIGLFHLPRVVLMDLVFLQSLPQKQWLCGIAELTKHALLYPPLWQLLNQIKLTDLKNNQQILTRALLLSAQYKMNIVAQDFEEKTGKRKILNLGHTFGRALETASDFKLSHGEAVAVGLTAAIKLSQQTGLLAAEKAKKALELIEKFNLPTKAKNLSEQKVWQAMTHDKKSVLGQPCFVLLEDIGKPKVDCLVDKKISKKVMNQICL